MSLAMCIVAALGVVGAGQVCPNGDFSDGLEHWRFVRGAEEAVRVVEVDGQPFRHALEIDARLAPRTQVQTEPFAVEQLQPYRLSAWVEGIRGEQGWSLHLTWHDAEDRQLAYEYAHVTPMVVGEWIEYAFDAVSPEGAVTARINAELPDGWACRIADVRLTPREPIGTRLAIDLMPEPATAEGAELVVRIENRGDTVLEEGRIEIALPEGISTSDAREFTGIRLSFGQAFTARLWMEGQPARSDEPIRCTVTGRADGEAVTLTQKAFPFMTTAREVVTSTEELPAPQDRDMDILLGCYYFPVMLDWDRMGWGVRRVDYLEPKLGYYDEARPEVADWHIYWALEHGISFFVFDWYYNQGMDYLNDALEEGFLKSRFADRMQFCIDWCNEGHCGQFKPVDFGMPALESFMTTLCERYLHLPNYLRVDGKPVVLIHVPLKIINAHGGWEGGRKALEGMRDVARRYGHPGVYFVAVQNNLPHLVDYQKAGFDAVTSYAYGFRDQSFDRETRALSYAPLIPRHHECFDIAQEEAHTRGLDYIPTAWVGWDDAARSRERAVRTEGNTPGAFRRALEALPRYVESDTRLALFESWNEWGEGGQAEPGQPYGFGRLSAVRDVLTRDRGPYDIAVPRPEDVAGFQTDVTWADVHGDYLCRYARTLGLEKGLTLEFEGVSDLHLPGGSQIRDIRFADGCQIVETTGADPVLFGPPCMNLPASEVASVTVRMRATAGERMQLFWQREEDTVWDETASIELPLIADGAFHEYTFDLEGHPHWEGIVRQFRFDPTDAAGEVAIDRFATEK